MIVCGPSSSSSLCVSGDTMASRATSESSSLLLSRGEEPPPYEQRSVEETAKSKLVDPTNLTSFDETGRKVSRDILVE